MELENKTVSERKPNVPKNGTWKKYSDAVYADEYFFRKSGGCSEETELE